MLRDQDSKLLEKQRLYVEYRQPDGNVAGARWLDPINQTDGFYQDRFSIPTSAPLGKWTAYIKSNKNAQRAINQFTFNVSEFVPERMDMAVDIAKGQQNKIESLPVSVDGQYLSVRLLPAIKSTFRRITRFVITSMEPTTIFLSVSHSGFAAGRIYRS